MFQTKKVYLAGPNIFAYNLKFTRFLRTRILSYSRGDAISSVDGVKMPLSGRMDGEGGVGEDSRVIAVSRRGL